MTSFNRPSRYSGFRPATPANTGVDRIFRTPRGSRVRKLGSPDPILGQKVVNVRDGHWSYCKPSDLAPE